MIVHALIATKDLAGLVDMNQVHTMGELHSRKTVRTEVFPSCDFEAVANQLVDRLFLAGQEQPLVWFGFIDSGKLFDELKGVVSRVDGDRDEPDGIRMSGVLVQGQDQVANLATHRGTLVHTACEDEVGHPRATLQIVERDRAAGLIGEREIVDMVGIPDPPLVLAE